MQLGLESVVSTGKSQARRGWGALGAGRVGWGSETGQRRGATAWVGLTFFDVVNSNQVVQWNCQLNQA
jgi:hypothetical protein